MFEVVLPKGIGVGQVLATAMGTTYYASILALIIRYFVSSFYPVLPWSYCKPEWGTMCIDSAGQKDPNSTQTNHSTTSAEFYF